jgi:hypothetical protein
VGAAALVAATVLIGCSSTTDSSSPSSAASADQAGAPTGTESVGLSPAGVTTRIDVPAQSTEEQYAQACMTAKEWIDARGHWVQDREFGRQFKADILHVTPPDSPEGIERYLASGLVKGVGPTYARKLVARFGTGSATVAATQDLQLISGLPPLVREGDRYRAMFTLRNTTARAMTVEVETSDCTITAMSPGAEFFFKDAPWGSMMGQSLRDFVQWEDLDNINDLMSSPVATPAGHDSGPSSVSGSRPASPASPLSSSCSSASSSRRESLKFDAHAEYRCIRLMHFTSMESDMPSRPRCASCWAAAYSSDDSEGPGCQPVHSSRPDGHGNEVPFTLLPPVAARGWSDAFEHDPMLCDQQEANDNQGRFLAKYVQTSMQVLPVAVASPTEPYRVLVAISLL